MHANLSCDFCSSFAPVLAEQTSSWWFSWQDLPVKNLSGFLMRRTFLSFPVSLHLLKLFFLSFWAPSKNLFFLLFNSVIIYSPSWVSNMYNSQISFTPLHIHTWTYMFGYVRTYENHRLASLASNLAQHVYFKWVWVQIRTSFLLFCIKENVKQTGFYF